MRPEDHGIEASHARPLSGLSGTAVWLISDDGERWRVRKIADAPERSARLEVQLAKQAELGGHDSAPVSVPKVLESGRHQDRFWFDMEFVQGIDGPTYLRRASVAEVRSFAEGLCRYLEWSASMGPCSAIEGRGSLFDGVFERVCRIQDRTAAIPAESFQQLTMAAARLRALDVAPTWCHGDLTLENLQVDHHGRFWFFDLLDAPHEHVWQDIAKLHQDLSGGWYRRNHQPISPATLDFVGRSVLEAATRLDGRYADAHHLLVALCFARILPYATDGEARDLAVRGLAHFARLAHQE